jgi:DNA polymerase I-like protein with 3'-5' exonuclease and polymerase domains
MHGVKPSGDDLWNLTHRQPNSGEVARAYKGLSGSIQRQGKNHAIQGTNATIAKLAMGCGFDKDGVPYLWHTLPKYKAKIIKFVHDELVFQCPARYKEEVKALVKDAFKRAAAAVMTLVVMESEANAETYWSK